MQKTDTSMSMRIFPSLVAGTWERIVHIDLDQFIKHATSKIHILVSKALLELWMYDAKTVFIIEISGYPVQDSDKKIAAL